MSTKRENENDSANGTKPLVSRRFVCDHCEQEWEIDFKCPKCSDKLITVEGFTPKLDWSGSPFEDEMEWGEEDEYTGDVCYNCCNCQFNGG